MPTAPLAQRLDIALAPLDAMRSALLQAAGPLARATVVQRSTRVATWGALGITTAWLGTLVAPLWLLTLGPALWGPAHLLADLRYLVVQPGLHRRASVWIAVWAPACWAFAGGGARAAMFAAFGAALVSRGAPMRRAALALASAALFLAAVRARGVADLAFAHLHHFIAIVAWWTWRPRRSRLTWIPLVLFVLPTVAIVSGVTDGWLVTGTQRASGTGFALGSLAASLAPGVPFVWGVRLVALYAFAQSVHYVVWLRLVPDDARPQATPRSFRQTARALEADLGSVVLAVCALGAIAMALGSLVDATAARAAYVHLSVGHGAFEIGALVIAWCERPRA